MAVQKPFTRSYARRRLLAVTGALLVSLGLLAAPGAGADSGEMSPACRPVTTTVPGSVLDAQVVPVPPGVLGADDELTIAGRLCLPRAGKPATVVLALHGITYAQEYWDAQFEPERYSFARAMNDAGYAVYAIDRLGYGRSSHPAGLSVTLDVQAEVAHQVVQQLKAGAIGEQRFDHVALVGHSYGSAVSWMESSRYNDADVVIATGWGSSVQTEPTMRFFAGFQPATLDDRLGPQIGLDLTYLTPKDGARNQNYLYDLSNVDPKMVRYDSDVLRDTVTVGELTTVIPRFNKFPVTYFPGTSEELSLPGSDHTREITVPQFLLNGTNDLLFCGPDTKYCNNSAALQAEQEQYFDPAACFRAEVLENTGHNLNLHRSAQQSYAIIAGWLDEALGSNGRKKQPYLDSCRSVR